MILFFQPGIPQNKLFLDRDESRHCVKVLRKRKGDTIDITDGRGCFYKAIITSDDPDECVFSIQETLSSHRPAHALHLAIAPTKNIDRTEWFVEKAVEIGISKISFIESRHSERSRIKIERMEKIAISAMKQSLKATLPQLDDLQKLDHFLSHASASQKFIAHIDPQATTHLFHAAHPKTDTCLLIGPEGGFSEDEVALARRHNFVPISLGPSRLRTETAALMACAILSVVNL